MQDQMSVFTVLLSYSNIQLNATTIEFRQYENTVYMKIKLRPYLLDYLPKAV